MTSNAVKKAKKANLLDQHSINTRSRTYWMSLLKKEDVRLSNIKLFLGLVVIAIALAAQFYLKEFLENKNFLTGCILLYVVVSGLLQLITYTKGKNAILSTFPPEGSFTSTGLVVFSKLPRSSDLYPLTIASSDPKSISANKPIKLTQCITNWFTKDGVLVEGLFWNGIGLVSDYAKERQITK